MSKIEDLALAVGLRPIAGLDLSQYGYQFRKNKTNGDLTKARKRAFSTAPFKTEMHLSLLESHLTSIVKTIK